MVETTQIEKVTMTYSRACADNYRIESSFPGTDEKPFEEIAIGSSEDIKKFAQYYNIGG